ncbi:lactosylceramide 1,3-N-acetyl-beta-D-glucosaminyltransferase B [Octopus bimaculoides]|uniref:Hexosyltransferase n=1 Tax=Octopus bimaculoides TaxID=37653 RepID=A0A0L8G7W6_OCTBM|nr:lactosylceramide 1,3-N-acetyl-beta-D-glucosaminyltransferase B [Octopus bimaculoides]|eukprot:XP_014783287.1 PREDICTED: lactosylceramide 1,3-N-acetyl-beta-D-glucosaminyltransferase B-like [Octopus bimaculoides]
MRIYKKATLIFTLLALCGFIVYKMSYSFDPTILQQYKPVWAEDERLNIVFLFAVKSYPENYEMRKAIRETWSTYISSGSNSKILFYMGRSSRPEINAKVAEEFNHYEDIFQGDFIDSFENQSLCTLTALKYMLRAYAEIRFLFKVHDSTFVNIPRLIRVLKSKRASLHNFIMGRITNNSKPERNKKSPWYISKDMYPPDSYPVYTQGDAYLLSGNLIQQLVKESFKVPLIWIEDIFVTGILTKNLNVNYIHSTKFGSPQDSCENGEYIAISGLYTVEDMKRAYKAIEVPNERCAYGIKPKR